MTPNIANYSIFELSPLGSAYSRLIMEGWKPPQALYMAWKSHPKDAREAAGLPLHQIELFTKVLMYKSDTAVRLWRTRFPDMEERILTIQREGPLSYYRPGALHAVGQSAQMLGREGFQDRKMLLEMTGDYRPTSTADITTGGKPIQPGATAEELAMLLAQARKELSGWQPEEGTADD